METRPSPGPIGIPADIGEHVLFNVGDTPVTAASLLAAVLLLLVAWLLSTLAKRAIDRTLIARNPASEGGIRSVTRIGHYLVMTLTLLSALRILGIDLSTLVAAGAVLAVGVGIALQDVTQNFVSGMILLMERTIKPGDVLEVDGQTVRVVRIGIRATVAGTLDDESLIIPNSFLVQSSVKNYTLGDPICRLRAKVGVSYGSDMTQVRRVLEEAAGAMDWRVPQRDPVILLLEFGASSVDWDVSVWIADPWRIRRLRSAMYETIWEALKEKGITIAFPQLDLHLDRGVTRALEGLPRVS